MKMAALWQQVHSHWWRKSSHSTWKPQQPFPTWKPVFSHLARFHSKQKTASIPLQASQLHKHLKLYDSFWYLSYPEKLGYSPRGPTKETSAFRRCFHVSFPESFASGRERKLGKRPAGLDFQGAFYSDDSWHEAECIQREMRTKWHQDASEWSKRALIWAKKKCPHEMGKAE